MSSPSVFATRFGDAALPRLETPTVDVVVPVLDEERTVGANVELLVGYLRREYPFGFRVVIADSASTDSTPEIAAALAAAHDEVDTIRLERRGRGLALRTAWLASVADVVAYMDVDLSTNLESFLPLVAPLLSGHSELAIGTRLAHQAHVRRRLEREVLSRGYNALVHAGFRARFSDAQCGFKALRADVARRLVPLVEDDGWFFDTELLLLAERNGLRIHEVPVDWIEDLDSRVALVPTIVGDLSGLVRMRRAFWRGGGHAPQAVPVVGGAAVSSPAVPLARGHLTSRLTTSWHRVALGGVLGLAAFLDLFRLSQNGYANTYYSAAVRSMLSSWHNFFFVSFDPGGLVSVDKPPLALWVQAASAKVLGYSGVSILLPEALAGVAAVGLLYLLVAQYFGRVAGLVAALALAVSPVSVAVNRDNNPDALFALLLVASAYVGARAVESGRLSTLLATAVLVGLALNTKMLAAALVVPGIGLAYLFLVRRPWRTRLVHAALATVVLVAVSGAWIAAVELTAPGNRPYVGSTSDNSALSLALGYNGLGRVTGQEGGTSFGGGLGGAFSGLPGTWRLLNDALGDQGAWLLPLAIVGGASALVAAIALRRRRRLAALVVVGGWFVAGVAVFSYSSGIIHTYYLSALAPATSALVGIGAVSLWRDARRGGAWVALPIAAVALTAWLQLDLLRRSGYASWLQAVVLLGAVLAVAAVAALGVAGAFGSTPRRRLATSAVALALVSLLAAPTVWSATTFRSAVNGVFPGAGPNYISGGGGGFRGGPPGGGLGAGQGPGRGFSPPGGVGGPGGGGSSDLAAALDYVESHGAASRFGLIVTSEQEAAAAVVAGEPVAAMGGFTGRETVLTAEYLARLIRSGEARYFLLGAGGGFPGRGGSNNTAVSTVESACSVVPASEWASGLGSSQSSLYDCAGSADAILADG